MKERERERDAGRNTQYKEHIYCSVRAHLHTRVSTQTHTDRQSHTLSHETVGKMGEGGRPALGITSVHVVPSSEPSINDFIIIGILLTSRTACLVTSLTDAMRHPYKAKKILQHTGMPAFRWTLAWLPDLCCTLHEARFYPLCIAGGTALSAVHYST